MGHLCWGHISRGPLLWYPVGVVRSKGGPRVGARRPQWEGPAEWNKGCRPVPLGCLSSAAPRRPHQTRAEQTCVKAVLQTRSRKGFWSGRHLDLALTLPRPNRSSFLPLPLVLRFVTIREFRLPVCGTLVCASVLCSVYDMPKAPGYGSFFKKSVLLILVKESWVKFRLKRTSLVEKG